MTNAQEIGFDSFCNSVIEPVCISYDDKIYDCQNFANVTCEDIEDQTFISDIEMKRASEQIKQAYIMGESSIATDERFKVTVLRHLLRNNSKK